MALLAAIVLLAMSTALVVGTFSLARALRRAATSNVARTRVEEGIWRAFGDALQGWSVALDSLPAGGSIALALPGEPLDAVPRLQRLARVEHVANGLYAITVELCAYDCAAPLAQRRARLWLQRATAAGQSVPPQLVTPWAFVDLY
jgi:hypothetical protein